MAKYNLNMVNHQISDLIARVNNGRLANLKEVKILRTKETEEIVNLLAIEGYISNFKGEGRVLDVDLKSDGFEEIKVVSKPGRRIYRGYKSMGLFREGLGQYFVRTSKGIMTSDKAIELKLGGEILLKIR